MIVLKRGTVLQIDDGRLIVVLLQHAAVEAAWKCLVIQTHPSAAHHLHSTILVSSGDLGKGREINQYLAPAERYHPSSPYIKADSRPI